MATATYDPGQVVANFLGSIITGYAEGTFVEVEYNEDAVSLHVGAAGDGVRSINRNRSGLIRFTLLGSSPSNDVLTAAAALDQLTGDGKGPCFIKDLSGTSLHLAPTAWVRKLPNGAYSKTMADMNRTWELESDYIDSVVGGITV